MCLLDNILPVHWAKAMSIEQILGYKGPVCFCVARMKGPGQRGGWQEGSWWALPVGRGKLDYVKLMRGDRAKQHQASCRLYDPPQIMASADPESGKRPSDPKQLRPSYCSLQSWCNQMVLKSQKKERYYNQWTKDLSTEITFRVNRWASLLSRISQITFSKVL